MHATGVHRCTGDAHDELVTGRGGKQQPGMAVTAPEAAQRLQGHCRQGDIAILAALAITDVHTPLAAIDISDLQSQTLCNPKAQAIDHQQKDPVAQLAHRVDQEMNFLPSWNVRQRAHTRGTDNLDPFHLPPQHIAVEEL